MQAILSPLSTITIDVSWSRWSALSLLLLVPFDLSYPIQFSEPESIEQERLRLELTKKLPAEYKSRASELARTLLDSADKHKITPALILALMETESSFIPHAKSKAGAIGLLQLLPKTAEEISRNSNIPYSGQEDLYNPVVNLQLGISYLAYLKTRFKEKNHYLAAYNFGPTAVGKKLRAGNRQLLEAQAYVGKIRSKEKAYSLQSVALR